MADSFWGQSLGTKGLIGLGYASALAPFVTSTIGGILGSNAGKESAADQFMYQSMLQNQAALLNYRYGQRSLKTSPLAQRQGLIKAGYNPMLAVQNATSGANSGWTSSGQAQSIDYAGAISAGVANAQSIQRLKNETAQTESNVRLNEAQGRNAISEAVNNEIHSKYLDRNEESQLGKIGAETDKLIRETSYYDQLAENMEAQRRLEELGIYVGADTARYSADKAYNATTYSANKSYDATKYSTDNNMIKAGVGAALGTAGLIYGPAKLKALRLLGKTKAIGF